MSKCLSQYNAGNDVRYCQLEERHAGPCGSPPVTVEVKTLESIRPIRVHVLRNGADLCEGAHEPASAHERVTMAEWIDQRDRHPWIGGLYGKFPCPVCNTRARHLLEAFLEGKVGAVVPPIDAAIDAHDKLVSERWEKFDAAMSELADTLEQVRTQAQERRASGGLTQLKNTVKAVVADAAWLMEKARELRR